MKSTKIPPEQWVSFCEEFTRQHLGWQVRVSISNPPDIVAEQTTEIVGPYTLLIDTVFFALSVGPADRQLVLALGDAAGDRAEVILPRTLSLFMDQTEDGAHAGLHIDSADNQTARLRFRVPAWPEMLDGIAPSEWQAESADKL